MVHEQILEQLRRFESGQLAYQQLEEWLASHLQQILDSREPRAIELANELDAFLIEEGEGLRSLDEVRREFATLYTRELSTAWIEYFGAQRIRSSSDHTIHKQWGESQVTTGLRTLQVA